MRLAAPYRPPRPRSMSLRSTDEGFWSPPPLHETVKWWLRLALIRRWEGLAEEGEMRWCTMIEGKPYALISLLVL
ncbi:hypothetical protein C2S53_017176 [Perilla frutescens var. hirtella]|uniref:Uncharacterized protein n=1 Tax=Perilla frutescens var. hirtella TaxID=608512 RepID=A0AAD4P6Q4_PERFH|nr:hypothetical protein C2S53_017176 [Perilla frutescens var. hirtella]